ncbi:MAG TPA: hypothetical protein QF889_02095 [Flavobacteriaceae bacterium]|jgi:uncharacterized membrane protein YecN with MAPEG domain|nr:hypothetical protein [Flavobacteriaceae bacterium]|tara:strand:+ start:1092 stop:1349 length:258 start_codon:yes stop_codon:yes gene_type:complete
MGLYSKKIFIKILSILLFGGILFGVYYREIIETSMGDKIIGFFVIFGAFIFMPLFLIYRLKGKKFEDYTLSDKNIKRMRERSGKN